MASKNKIIGRKAERKFVAWFAERFGLVPYKKDRSGANLAEAQIARAEEISQLLDNSGVDIWFREDTGLSSLNVQIKSTLVKGKKSKSIDIEPLTNMPEGLNILFTEIKTRPGKRNMMHYADIVSMKLEDFAEILSVYQAYKLDDDDTNTSS